MDLKIKDVAELLNVSEITIRQWLSEGKIPSYKINNQYRFSRNEIENWVIHNKQLKELHSDIENEEGQSSGVGSNQFSLYRALHKGNVFKDVSGETKEEVIRNTMKKVSSSLNLDADVLTELLLDREQLQPTALNNGIGIPHTRDFLLNAHHNVVVIVYPKKPLEYGALDGKPVHTLFFLFACDDKKHLNLLAKIAHLSSQTASQALLLKQPNKDEFLSFIKEWETSINKYV